MLIRKWLAVFAVLGSVTTALFAVSPNVVISLDGAALKKHPQIVKLQAEQERKAKENGEKTIAEMLTDHKLTDAIQECRFSFYLQIENNLGVFVIDTPEGKAPELFEQFCQTLDYAEKGTKSEIGGFPAFVGSREAGDRETILLRSPSQIQIQVEDGFPVPVDFSGISKNLVLATKTERLVNIAFVPSAETLKEFAATAPGFQALQIMTLGLENTEPEVELVLDGAFRDNESAQSSKLMVDMMLIVLQQNPQLEPRLFENIRSRTEGNKVYYRRTVDAGFLDAAVRSLGHFGLKFPALSSLMVDAPAPVVTPAPVETTEK